ncbi:GNAT family N-acetyltransferase [Undibacterium sp. TJN19]|uniref:GNAT family N-acetyltransferase n=1 Tax=Undibacterium sp. TJN19 TaxID=3413055 RepID=UPI003BF38F46
MRKHAMTAYVRLMQQADLTAVFHIQSLAYVPTMVEAMHLLAARLDSAPETVWVAERDGEILAYLMAYPCARDQLSALGQTFQVAKNAEALYLHDLAVHPKMAGQGLAQSMVSHALDYARQQGLLQVLLVSVQSTGTFWQRLGFVEQAHLEPAQLAKLASYAGPAHFMQFTLQGA